MGTRRDKEPRKRRWLVRAPDTAPLATQETEAPQTTKDTATTATVAPPPPAPIFDDERVAPGAAPPTEFLAPEAPATPPATAPEPSKYRPVRWLVLGLLTLAGGVTLAAAERDCSGFNSAGEAAGAIISAVLATAFWFAVIATGVYVVCRARHRRRSWRHAQLSTSTFVLGTAFVLLASAGIAAHRSNDCGSTGAAVPSAHAKALSGQELTAQQRSVVVYLNGFIRCTEAVTSARGREKRMMSAIGKGQWMRAAGYAIVQERLFDRYSKCLHGVVPTDDAELAGPAARSAASIALMARAWGDYKRGAQQVSLGLLKRGDRRVVLAQRRARRAAADVETVYHRRGGAELANHINLDRLLKVRERAGLS
jgi:hypothetical protein